MSLSYETQTVQVEQLVERTTRETGWVSRFRIIETLVRVVVTRVAVELVGPDGTTVVSRYVTPTRYVETEYIRDRTTVFLGVTRIAQPITIQPVTPPRPIAIQPTPGTTTEAGARRPEAQPQPVPTPVATVT